MKDTVTYPLSAITGDEEESRIDQLARELAETKEQLYLCNVDQFTTAAELAEARTQRDKAIAFLHVYRNDTPLGNQPHMLAHEIDQFLKECGK